MPARRDREENESQGRGRGKRRAMDEDRVEENERRRRSDEETGVLTRESEDHPGGAESVEVLPSLSMVVSEPPNVGGSQGEQRQRGGNEGSQLTVVPQSGSTTTTPAPRRGRPPTATLKNQMTDLRRDVEALIARVDRLERPAAETIPAMFTHLARILNVEEHGLAASVVRSDVERGGTERVNLRPEGAVGEG